MTIQIRGKYSEDNRNMMERTFTAEEATELIKNGHRGMLSFFGEYEIDGIKYHASALSVGDETYIYEQNGKLVIPTYFQKGHLANYDEGDQREKVLVDVVIDPTEVEFLHLTLVKH